MNKWIKLIGAGGIIYLLSKRDPDKIGKLYDVNPVRGGRIDQYWINNVDNYSTQLMGKNADRKKYLNDPELAATTFGLQGIEFGNWMNQSDRLSHHVSMMQSLKDLSTIMKIPMSAVGRGKLAVAMGARGKGGALAHYESSDRYTINITKEKGPGSLAHEFGHYIDNYVGRRFLGKNSLYASGGRSTRMLVDTSHLNKKTIRGAMERIINTLYYNADGSPTVYYEKQKAMDSEYLYRRTEVFARTFEQYTRIKLKQNNMRNDYLVSRAARYEEPDEFLVRKIIPEIDYLIKKGFK